VYRISVCMECAFALCAMVALRVARSRLAVSCAPCVCGVCL